MTHAQFFAAFRARTDRQMRPRDCSAPPASEADQQNSAVLLLLGRCDSTPVANTKGSALWQEQAPATPADIEFASSATASVTLNDECRMSNVEGMTKSEGRRRQLGVSLSEHSSFVRHSSFGFRHSGASLLPALPRITYWRQTFSKLLLLALGLSLLVRLSRLLLRSGTRTRTAYQRDK